MNDDIDTERIMAALRLARHDLNAALLEADAIYDNQNCIAQNLDIKSTMHSWAGDFSNAENLILRAISIDSQNVSLTFHAAQLYFKFRQYSKAIEYFELTMNMCVEDETEIYKQIISVHLGYCFIKVGAFDKARSVLEACDLDEKIWLHGLTTPREMLRSIA